MESPEKKYLDQEGVSYLWGKITDKVDDKIEELPPYEADGGVDTLFDTEYNATKHSIDFKGTAQNPTTTARYESATQKLIIEGAAVVCEDEDNGTYVKIIIS